METPKTETPDVKHGRSLPPLLGPRIARCRRGHSVLDDSEIARDRDHDPVPSPRAGGGGYQILLAAARGRSARQQVVRTVLRRLRAAGAVFRRGRGVDVVRSDVVRSQPLRLAIRRRQRAEDVGTRLQFRPFAGGGEPFEVAAEERFQARSTRAHAAAADLGDRPTDGGDEQARVVAIVLMAGDGYETDDAEDARSARDVSWPTG